MKPYEKCHIFLAKIINLSCPAVLVISLLLATVVYPAYSFIFNFSHVNIEVLTETVSVFASVLCLCRLIMIPVGYRLSKTLTAELIFCTFAFAAAYFFRHYGGFSVKGYVFSLAASLFSPYALFGWFFEKYRKADEKSLNIFFLISSILFIFLSMSSAVISVMGSSLTAAIILRLTALPIIMITACAVCFGKKCRRIGMLSYISARLFSFVPALYILITAADFAFAHLLQFAFPAAFAIFLIIVFFNAFAIKKPSAFPRFFSV